MTDFPSVRYFVPSRKLLDRVVEEAMDASILFEADGIIVAWNSYAEQLLGWSAKDAIGNSLPALIIPSQYQPAFESNIKQFIETGRDEFLNRELEAVFLHKTGHGIVIKFSIAPVCLKGYLYFNTIIRDRDRYCEAAVLEQQTSILALSRDAIIVTNINSEIQFWNNGAEKMFGYPKQKALGKISHELLRAEYPLSLTEIEQQLVASGHWEGEVTYRMRNGARLNILSRWALERDSNDGAARILMSCTDVGIWKRLLEASAMVKASEQRFDSLFGLHPDGVFALGLDGYLISANPALSMMTGYSIGELNGISLPTLVAPGNHAEIHVHFLEALCGSPQTYEFICIRKDDSRFDACVTMLPYIVDNKTIGLHGIVKDISHRKHDERRILYLATHDPLTGLPNRNMLNDRMQHAIEQARRLHSQVGVLFMDLNRFKLINDSLGHDKGDILLCAIADRLKNAVREVDTVARLGGDEFVVLLENINAASHVFMVAQNLLKLVEQPVDLEDNVVTISTSIGASVYPRDGNDTVTLLKHADLAMYEAKDSGCGYRLYAPEMKTKAVGRLTRENDLRRAFECDELRLYYQPRLDIAKNQIVGVEALLRWEHPEKGLILPVNFISLAEEIGMIGVIGEWVLLTACRQLKCWHDAGLLPVKLSVNISAVQLQSDRIFDTIANALTKADLDPDYLELEITESSLMQNLDASYDKLLKIRELGVTFSIDDFGTGYSSLNYLKRLPIDTLKIDKSFIKDVAQNNDDAAIVTATIAMAHSMNLRVVAEGVTSYDQVHFLESCVCDEIQGYLLCQPLPPSEIELFFKTSQLRGIYYSWMH